RYRCVRIFLTRGLWSHLISVRTRRALRAETNQIEQEKPVRPLPPQAQGLLAKVAWRGICGSQHLERMTTSWPSDADLEMTARVYMARGSCDDGLLCSFAFLCLTHIYPVGYT